MYNSEKVHEKFLTEIWKKQNFKNLFTNDGQKIEIIDSGIENSEKSGPDFRNARIKIGNITYFGDVEIDSFHTDWKSHGHNINKNYNKVILHAVLESDKFQQFVYTQDGRKVNSVCIKSILSEDISAAIQKAIKQDRENRKTHMKCSSICENLNLNDKNEVLFALGIQRLKLKSSKVLDRLKEIVFEKEMKSAEPMINYSKDEKFYDRDFKLDDFADTNSWNQVLYELLFEALGYSNNKDVMLKLAKRADLDFLSNFKDQQDFKLILESILLNIAGLIPQNNNFTDPDILEYKRRITEIWSNLSPKYDGKTLNSTFWHFFKLRPSNFPTLRIAGGAVYIDRILNHNLFTHLNKSFKKTYEPARIISDLRNQLIVGAEGFWQHHYVFEQRSQEKMSYFVGVSRVDEIIVNVILPIYSLYFEMFGKKEIAERVIKVYLQFCQNTDNSLIREIAQVLGLAEPVKRSVLHQGILELFRSYCSKDKCLECPIGEKVFN